MRFNASYITLAIRHVMNTAKLENSMDREVNFASLGGMSFLSEKERYKIDTFF